MTLATMDINGKEATIFNLNSKEVMKKFNHIDGKFIYLLQDYKEDYKVQIVNEEEIMSNFHLNYLKG